MMWFSDMSEFQRGYQFFMLRPSRAIRLFIITVAGAVAAALIWASTAKMDDVIKADALLRSAETISSVRAVSGGEALKKNYTQDSPVMEGELLLQLDVSADALELENSKKFMERIENAILIYTALLETIRSGNNRASSKNEEAHIRSVAYLIEYQRRIHQIEGLKARLAREKSLPESSIVKQELENKAREIEQAKLQFSLWENNQTIETIDILKSLTQNKENLERRISDLERNIRNATIYAPISGKINEIKKFNIGDYLLSGEEILAIIPNNTASLKAELYVSPAYIAQVKPGQKATLRFPGLPPSRFGKLDAEISLILADYVSYSGSEPVFIVEASVQEPWLTSAKGERIYLRSGIGAKGRIIIKQDTVIGMTLRKIDFMYE
ncbi:MAG: HlyD family efflux transporter periplasmic adaptor subunit [Treponema sp.]|jgi:adhesin transport system membrane fusion protein|nr:HlyD family efflux transporter periplasmic adaptor subunit [Treponema sp.]